MKKFTMMALMLAALSVSGCQLVPVQQAQTSKTMVKTMAKSKQFDVIDSRYDFQETLQVIQSGLESKGMTVFAVIDHQEAAQKTGLMMHPATVLVFGNPKAGTPLMLKDANFAVQLPLKVLVTEIGGQVQVVMQKPEALIVGSEIERADIENTLAKANGLIASLVK